jgi:uncharacterized membrane protein (DUF4010 family)
MQLSQGTWIGLGAALGIGLLVGSERERRKGDRVRSLSAGIRTFALTSLVGAGAMAVGGEGMLAVAALAIGSLVTISFWRNIAGEPGITTGVALLLTLLLGGLAMRDTPIAVAIGVVSTLLLASKAWMHNFVRKVVTEAELHDGLLLAAAALVVLPLIPDAYLGPFNAFNPRTTWIIVVLMMAIGVLGHVSQRLLGASAGLVATGFVSGFASSVATIGSMGERVRRSPALMSSAVAGAVVSSVATVIQLAVLLAVTSMATLYRLAVPLLCAGMAAAVYAAIFTARTIREPVSVPAETGAAFSVARALGLALTVSAVIILSSALQAWFGQAGLAVGVALAGFGDAHAAAVSVASLVASGKLPASDAVLPILCGLTMNTVTKVVFACTAGARQFALQVVPGLVLLIGVTWISFVVTR